MSAINFDHFRQIVYETIEIITLDLDVLENVANQANSATNTSSTTDETTQRPDDELPGQAQSVKVSRCTIPISMVCFSVVDMFGQWVNLHGDDDFAQSSTAFFTKLAKRDDLKKEDAATKFKEVFRHGVMHSFFAKKGFSMAYPPYDNNSLFISNHKENATLDVRYLLKVVRIGMNNLKSELMDEKSEMSEVAFAGYQRWLQKQ